MNKAEFKEAMAIAGGDDDLTLVDTSSMIGYGLATFKKVAVTLRMVASMIRYQALQMNGEWDAAELDSIRYYARYKFEIIG